MSQEIMNVNKSSALNGAVLDNYTNFTLSQTIALNFSSSDTLY